MPKSPNQGISATSGNCPWSVRTLAAATETSRSTNCLCQRRRSTVIEFLRVNPNIPFIFRKFSYCSRGITHDMPRLQSGFFIKVRPTHIFPAVLCSVIKQSFRWSGVQEVQRAPVDRRQTTRNPTISHTTTLDINNRMDITDSVVGLYHVDWTLVNILSFCRRFCKCLTMSAYMFVVEWGFNMIGYQFVKQGEHYLETIKLGGLITSDPSDVPHIAWFITC